MELPGEAHHDLPSLLRDGAARFGDRPAVRFSERALSYAALDAESDRFAAGLAAAGFGPGDKLGLFLFNCPEFLLLWFGAAKIGVVTVPLNTALKGELLRYELDDCQAKGLVLDARLYPEFAAVAGNLPISEIWILPSGDPSVAARDIPNVQELPKGGSPPAHPVAPWDAASILYTSGTTGPPKGAVIPHEKYLRTSREVGERSRLVPGSVLFTALPLFHCNAQEMTTLAALQNGLTAAYDERFSASRYWESAAGYGATHVSLLISMINVLYKQPERPTDRTHRVRTALTAGTSKELWRPFEERFGLEVVELYGMTECGCTTLMNPVGGSRVGSIGTPLGFVEAQVVDDRDEPVPDGTRGELIVRPRAPYTMFLEYYRKPEKTVEAWRNLWFHTGDYVTRDADGYYYFVDRKKDIIRRRGENLAPYDVESALQQHPAVLECVVVGVPSPLGEEDVKAFVRLKPDARASAEELFRFCAEKLPYFMVPRYLEFLDEIPKTANQKAQRYVLRSRPPGDQVDRESLGITLRAPR
ncbi:MAG TPA: AMP-binding protein [Thermoplasmata archaeon]|nr:AMP-binding protein [Thermoplasmata archaeon]